MNVDNPSDSTDDTTDTVSIGPAARWAISIVITAYLLLVLMGPLSNPIASADLTGPIARQLRPLHQALFIGHGYRFFGPDPGPGHILEYRIERADGSQVSDRFPDRESAETAWPRLRYHRWFMLSETVYQEINRPTDEEHQLAMKVMDVEIERLRAQRERVAMQQDVMQRDRLRREYELATRRSAGLVRAIARYLIERFDGQTIELQMRERLIPSPVDVASQVKLTDARYLSEPRPIVRFGRDELLPTEATQ